MFVVHEETAGGMVVDVEEVGDVTVLPSNLDELLPAHVSKQLNIPSYTLT